VSEEENNSKTKDIIDATAGLVKAMPVYDDALKPAAKEVGKALETTAKAVNLVLQPIRKFILKHEQIDEFISNDVAKKLKNVPRENIIEPKITVAGPALEAMRFAGNESELRAMYANLLANSMNSDYADSVHPAYVEIIKQLTPAEARLLKFLSDLDTYPTIYNYKQENQVKQGVIYSYSSTAREDGKARSGFASKVDSQFSKERSLMYLDNFLRLKLIEIDTYSSYAPGNKFGGFGSPSNHVMFSVISSGFVAFTAFGEKFIETCVREKG
jgi:hypothetical protein